MGHAQQPNLAKALEQLRSRVNKGETPLSRQGHTGVYRVSQQTAAAGCGGAFGSVKITGIGQTADGHARALGLRRAKA